MSDRENRTEIRVLKPEDLIRWVQDREIDFFPRGRAFSPDEAAALIVFEAIASVTQVTVERRGPWWIVWSKHDWLYPSDVSSCFQRIVSYPDGGQNSMRFELLLTVFARDVVTAAHGVADVVKGSGDTELDVALEELRHAGRLVAFRE